MNQPDVSGIGGGAVDVKDQTTQRTGCAAERHPHAPPVAVQEDSILCRSGEA